MPSDIPSPPSSSGTDDANLRHTFGLIQALEHAEDPEAATFALQHLEAHLRRQTPDPHTFIQAARYARDAGDVSPWTLTLLTHELAELMLRTNELPDPPATPLNEDDNMALMRQDAEWLAANLRALGAPDLAKLRLTSDEEYFNKIDDARLRALNLEDRSSYDTSLHMLPLAAVAVARLMLAHPDQIAPEHESLVTLARQVIALGDPGSKTLLTFERRSTMTLVCDGWRYASLGQADERARSVMQQYPNQVEDHFSKVLSLKWWIDNTTPPLLEIGLVCLGMTSMLPTHRAPAPAPLLMRGVARSIRMIASDWLRQRGYVRVHDVLVAALHETPSQL